MEKEKIENQEIKNQPKSHLSIIALCLLLARIFVTFVVARIIPKNVVINFLNSFPWVITSIILCIISRIKYKDKLSIIVLIIDLIIIAFAVLIISIAIYFFATFTSGCVNFFNDTNLLNNMSACKDIS